MQMRADEPTSPLTAPSTPSRPPAAAALKGAAPLCPASDGEEDSVTADRLARDLARWQPNQLAVGANIWPHHTLQWQYHASLISVYPGRPEHLTAIYAAELASVSREREAEEAAERLQREGHEPEAPSPTPLTAVARPVQGALPVASSPPKHESLPIFTTRRERVQQPPMSADRRKSPTSRKVIRGEESTSSSRTAGGRSRSRSQRASGSHPSQNDSSSRSLAKSSSGKDVGHWALVDPFGLDLGDLSKTSAGSAADTANSGRAAESAPPALADLHPPALLSESQDAYLLDAPDGKDMELDDIERLLSQDYRTGTPT